MVRKLLLLAALSAGCHRGDDADKPKAPPVPVTVVEVRTVATGDVADLLIATATVEAERSADLIPETSGLVKDIRRDVGDPVRAGDVLAVFENVTLDASAERARGEVAHLQAQVGEVERLRASGAASERELLDLVHQLDAARTSLREASRTAGETRLVAPFDGVVAARDLKLGELAQAGKRAFQVVDLRSMHVRARLPERDVHRVRLGQTARLVSAYDPSSATTATVTRIAPVIDSVTGTFEVTLALEAGQSALRPGQFVSVELEVDRHAGVVVVPKDAVRFEGGRPIAFVMVPAPTDAADTDTKADAEGDTDAADDGPAFVAKRVELELGLTDAMRSEITDGLQPGDQLVVVGQTTLRDGARIRPPAATTAAETPSAPAPASGG